MQIVVVENVPILSEKVECLAMPAEPSSGSKILTPPEHLASPISGSMDDLPKEPEPGHVEPSARVEGEEDQYEATSPAETPREMLGVEAHKDVLEVVVQPEEIPSSDDDCLNAEKLANHSLTHFLKSKSCEICMRAKMTARQHRKREDLDPEEAPPLYFGHQMRVDHIIIGSDLSKGSEGEQACLVCYDEHSGCYQAFPQSSRATDHNIACLRKFGGTTGAWKSFVFSEVRCSKRIG